MEALWKRRRALMGAAAVGVAATYIYRSDHTRKFARGVCASAEAFTKFAEIALTLSRDIDKFITDGGEEDQVPTSIKQALKLAQCPEAASLYQILARACTGGALEGAGLSTPASSAGGDNQPTQSTPAGVSSAGAIASDITDRVLDRVLSHRTAGIVTTLIGGSVRQCLEAYFDTVERQRTRGNQSNRAHVSQRNPSFSEMNGADSPGPWPYQSSDGDGGGDDYNPPPQIAYQLLELISTDQARLVTRDVITTFVTTLVGVYLENTANCNTVFEDSLQALSKPLHREAVAEVAGSIVRDAIRESVRACHEVVRSGSTQPGNIMGNERLAATPESLKSGYQDSAMKRRVTVPKSIGLDSPSDGLIDPSASASDRASAFSTTMDVMRIVGAPEVRLLARDVVGSAMWGTVRGLTDSVRELTPSSWTRQAAMPPAVILSVCMSMCLVLSGSLIG
mmetsp:Transcript_11955/g.20192  ORF Transcript_11955/g.20192 Transcript_11955/m.20192 type:complete len:451 (+) Transcript_11955:576-1928(+)